MSVKMNNFKVAFGNVFLVLIFKHFVIKIPRADTLAASTDHSPRKDSLSINGLCDLQNELNKSFPEWTIPAVCFDDFIVCPIPDGKSGLEYPQMKKELKERVEAIHQEMMAYGYRLGGEDVGNLENIYYDEDNDKITIIDYSHLSRI